MRLDVNETAYARRYGPAVHWRCIDVTTGERMAYTFAVDDRARTVEQYRTHWNAERGQRELVRDHRNPRRLVVETLHCRHVHLCRKTKTALVLR